MLKEFKSFILRGNVIDMAVGVAVGAAFGVVIASFTTNLLTPLIAIPGDTASLAQKSFTISGSQFNYGAFINDIITFVITGAVLFFLVVRPINMLMAKRRTEPEVESTTRDCPFCLSSIPVAATRCAFCTAEVKTVAG